MSRIETPYGVQHASIRIYIFNCIYNTKNWQDNPQPLLNILRDRCNRLPNFDYKTIKVCGLRKVLSLETEIHIDGIEYFESDRLNATDIDTLRSDIQDVLNNISGFGYEKVDVVSDKFLDNPTIGYINNTEVG